MALAVITWFTAIGQYRILLVVSTTSEPGQGSEKLHRWMIFLRTGIVARLFLFVERVLVIDGTGIDYMVHQQLDSITFLLLFQPLQNSVKAMKSFINGSSIFSELPLFLGSFSSSQESRSSMALTVITWSTAIGKYHNLLVVSTTSEPCQGSESLHHWMILIPNGPFFERSLSLCSFSSSKEPWSSRHWQ
ncbi:hypothetical protein AVEN_176554-1 [Araneus ventricosus]|uniref:Uncharacterized protein n=1 Tax=Araneus ventricosus TaxID=182803 RepID=A0A4Y2UU51_ARAVE|nr:hypothetical protein AVEN_176554-1 [Araneus ventricosus]